MNLDRKLVALMICCGISQSFAQQAEQKNEQLPSLEFLMYLGEWQDKQGNTIDPEHYSNEETALKMKKTQVNPMKVKIDQDNATEQNTLSDQEEHIK